MELHIVTPSTPAKPPPLWFVSNGDLTVGPVRTDLLVRGVRFGRVPDDVWVRELHWQAWRALWQIREVVALRRELAGEKTPRMPDVVGPNDRPLAIRSDKLRTYLDATRPIEALAPRNLLSLARDPAEVLHFGMHALAAATQSTFGMVHRFDQSQPWCAPTTSVVFGPGTLGMLGLDLAANDLVLGAARAKCLVMGPPESSSIHRSIALRLGAGSRTFAGVAMIPIQRHGEPIAMIELGRVDHAFRSSDPLAIAAIADSVAQRFSLFWS